MRGAPPLQRPSVLRAAADRVWVLLVAGASTGIVVVGVGGRLAMLLLRVTSADHVRGLVSDDGFVIGEVTLSGTYHLVSTGAGLGVVAAAAYTWVAPWLIGPLWFRRLSCALGAGAVIGSALVHDDGVDFTRLGPTWLAIALFVAIPAGFGAAVGVAVDRARSAVARPGTVRWRLALAAVLLAAFPPMVLILVPIAVVVVAWSALDPVLPRPFVAVGPLALIVRAGWMGVAVLGLGELVLDVQSLQ